RRIRLAQVTPSLLGGGIEHRTARLLRGMDRDRFEVAWAGFAPLRPSLIESAGPDVRMCVLPPHPPGLHLQSILRCARFLAKFRADVVHVHNWSASIYGVAAARLARVPTVLYGLGGRDGPEAPSPKRRLAMRALGLGIDGFTTVCEDLGARLEREFGVGPDRVHVVRTGIDVQRFHPADRGACRHALSWPQDAFMVGISGVHRPVKRLEDFLQAGQHVLQRYAGAQLVLIGFDGAEGLVQDIIDPGMRARVRHLGHTDEVHRVLPALDAYVCTSAFEGACNAIIEAMACGLPVLASRVGGNPELVAPDTGVLFEVGDTEALAEGLCELLENPELRAEMGAAARRRAERCHALSTMIDTYCHIYLRYHSRTR
ncbi:unnamed protein product, partial [Laminaria digitata]